MTCGFQGTARIGIGTCLVGLGRNVSPIVFADALWVLGGSNSNDFFDDVWSLRLKEDWIDNSTFPSWLRNIYRS